MNLSASSLAAVELCPARAHLPQCPRTHADAIAGTNAHAVLEAEARPGELAEQVFALNMATGEARALPRQAHRAYPDLGEHWLFGTCDLLIVEAERVVVVDWKTGYGYDDSGRNAPAASNLQLGFYSLCAARVYGKDAARVELRFTDTGRIDAADLDILALDAIWARLRAIYAAALMSEQSGVPRVRPGDKQCWRCPCFAGCPAQTTLALTLANGVDARELPTLELTPEAVAKGWARLKQIKAVLNEVERAYRGFASEQSVQLGSGKVLGAREKSREQLDGKVALRVLTDRLGADLAREAVEMETSKAAIERVIKSQAKKGTAAAELRSVLEAIRAADGVTTKTTHSVEEY